MRIKCTNATVKPFKAVAEERARKQRAKDRTKAIGAKPGDKDFAQKAKQYATPKTTTPARKPTSQSQAGRVLTPNEAETFFAKMFESFCKELPQLAVPGSQLRRLAVDPDRASAFARRFLANRRIAFCRKG